ncbi:hypothetical protein Gotur_020140, partial [Gossypium turneri]
FINRSSCCCRIIIAFNLKVAFLWVWNTNTYLLTYLRGSNSIVDIEEKVSPDEKIPWTKVHIEKGFEAYEKLLKDHARRYATGDEDLPEKELESTIEFDREEHHDKLISS